MATVSRKFKENFEIAVARWKALGDTQEQIDELKALIRIDLEDGDGALRDPENHIPDAEVRRKLWDDYFQAIANEEQALEDRLQSAQAGSHSRIVNSLLTE